MAVSVRLTQAGRHASNQVNVLLTRRHALQGIATGRSAEQSAVEEEQQHTQPAVAGAAGTGAAQAAEQAALAGSADNATCSQQQRQRQQQQALVDTPAGAGQASAEALLAGSAALAANAPGKDIFPSSGKQAQVRQQ